MSASHDRAGLNKNKAHGFLQKIGVLLGAFCDNNHTQIHTSAPNVNGLGLIGKGDFPVFVKFGAKACRRIFLAAVKTVT